MLASNKEAIIVKIPIGALGGNFKVGMGNLLDIKSYCGWWYVTVGKGLFILMNQVFWCKFLNFLFIFIVLRPL